MAFTTPAPSSALTPPTHPSPILKLPLHVVGIVLAHLDTIPELFPVVSSHSIFRDALKDNLHSVCRTIIANQIPPNALPFVIRSLESARIRAVDAADDATEVSDLMAYLATTVPGCANRGAAELPPPASLSFADYNFLSRHYANGEAMGKKLQGDVLDVFGMGFICTIGSLLSVRRVL
ncbi:hypothetical protein F4820DRAFT_471887 [Hypoxylon rubiginosum]|uniref:Uncharacterized protein n=1 Tax=Hypoxylon rubiginosum TaxID=110542 RepID=A0ACB9YV68_9PEZI|nr:hypothetical protein F4820DRAFT_471887 [Hypoxylon rubiginosum]